MRHLLTAASLVTFGATAALADETWTTPYGTAIYETDLGYVAVISTPTPTGTVFMYFAGLGGNFDQRSSHYGYWIGEGPGVCEATLTGPDGRASDVWGQAVIHFDGPAFPTAWTAVLGECFSDVYQPIRGELP